MFDSMILDILFEHRESIQIGDYQYLLECVRKRQSNPIDAEIDFCNQQMELGTRGQERPNSLNFGC